MTYCHLNRIKIAWKKFYAAFWGNLQPTCDVLTNALLISQRIYSLFQQLAQKSVSILQNVTLHALYAAVSETWTKTLTMTTLIPLGKEIASVLENAEIRDQCVK